MLTFLIIIQLLLTFACKPKLALCIFFIIIFKENDIKRSKLETLKNGKKRILLFGRITFAV